MGLVPTMGALHDGHRSLVEAAVGDNDHVVVSIFVNPLQFGPAEDLERYPRQLERDLQALARLDASLAVFAPSVEEMYPPGSTTRIEVGRLGEVFEGAARPGHFEGVATVVAKLFNAVEPDRAYFGQKDAQQVAVVRRLVRDLDFGLQLVVCPIVREPDGLAMSSRNAYLSPADRAVAPVVHRALLAAAHAWAQTGGPAAAQEAMQQTLAAAPGVEVDYADLVDPDSFELGGPLAVVAVRLAGVRLIDNQLLGGGWSEIEAARR